MEEGYGARGRDFTLKTEKTGALLPQNKRLLIKMRKRKSLKIVGSKLLRDI